MDYHFKPLININFHVKSDSIISEFKTIAHREQTGFFLFRQDKIQSTPPYLRILQQLVTRYLNGAIRYKDKSHRNPLKRIYAEHFGFYRIAKNTLKTPLIKF